MYLFFKKSDFIIIKDMNDIIKKKNNNLNLILKKSKNKKNIEKPKIAL